QVTARDRAMPAGPNAASYGSSRYRGTVAKLLASSAKPRRHGRRPVPYLDETMYSQDDHHIIRDFSCIVRRDVQRSRQGRNAAVNVVTILPMQQNRSAEHLQRFIEIGIADDDPLV